MVLNPKLKMRVVMSVNKIRKPYICHSYVDEFGTKYDIIDITEVPGHLYDTLSTSLSIMGKYWMKLCEWFDEKTCNYVVMVKKKID